MASHRSKLFVLLTQSRYLVIPLQGMQLDLRGWSLRLAKLGTAGNTSAGVLTCLSSRVLLTERHRGFLTVLPSVTSLVQEVRFSSRLCVV